MNIAIFGTGYVGLVTGACLAEVGNTVYCIDSDAERIADLNDGNCPIFEPNLPNILEKARLNKKIIFTTEYTDAIKNSAIIFIAVGTPQQADNGAADLTYVLQVSNTIGKNLNDYKVIINKSTVPVGTAELVNKTITEQLQSRNIDVAFDVVANPEFLKEGCAVDDCKKPDRIIIGTKSARAIELLKELYKPFNHNHSKIMTMDPRSAELTKYAANAMLATKISFINEMANIAEKVGADISEVRQGIGADPRIGYQFIYPGCGYGGSCFPKDVTALINMAKIHDYEAEMLIATHRINVRQKQRIPEKILQHYNGDVANKIFAVWGASFKPNTDDIREAPSIDIIKVLIANKARVQVYDPVANSKIAAMFANDSRVSVGKSMDVVLQNADSLIICTEWQEFRSPDFTHISVVLKDKVIFDGRNLYSPAVVAKHGIQYYCIGRT